MYMIAITGATGQLGCKVIKSLLGKTNASEIVAIVRNPEKAKDLAELAIPLRKADYNEQEGWKEALEGVNKLLLISSSEIGIRVKQHFNVIEAAKQSGVELLVYTSILNADKSCMQLAQEHKETEKLIRNSGVRFVFLRNGWYTENYTGSISNVLQMGALYGCAGNGKISSATRSDFAEAASIVLCKEQHDQTVYELAGDQSFTLNEFAAEISRQSGKQIPYVNISEDQYIEALVKAGLPDDFSAILADSETGASKGELFDEERQLGKVLGRPTTSLEEAVRFELSTMNLVNN